MAGSRPAFADPSDLAEWLGDEIAENSGEWKRADRLLHAASNLVRRQARRTWLDASGNLEDDLPDELADITLAAAARYYVNPDAETQWSSQVDDAMDGGGRKVDESGMYLTASEKATLADIISDESPVVAGIGTIRTTRGEKANRDMEREWFDGHPYLDATVTG